LIDLSKTSRIVRIFCKRERQQEWIKLSSLDSKNMVIYVDAGDANDDLTIYLTILPILNRSTEFFPLKENSYF
jgi:hypothetical protein